MMKGNSSEGKENAWTPTTTVSAWVCSLLLVSYPPWIWLFPSLLPSAPLGSILAPLGCSLAPLGSAWHPWGAAWHPWVQPGTLGFSLAPLGSTWHPWAAAWPLLGSFPSSPSPL